MNAIPFKSELEATEMYVEVEDLDKEEIVVQEDEDDGSLQKFGVSLKKSADVKSKEEAVEETRRRAEVISQMLATKALNDTDRLSFITSSIAYRRIENSMVTWVRNWRKPSIEELCKLCFMDVFYEVVSACDYVGDTAHTADVFRNLVIFTDCSYTASRILAEKGTIPILVRIISDEAIRTKLSQKVGEKFQGRLAAQALCTLHNLSKLPEYKSKFDECNAVEALKFYLADETSTAKSQMTALCALSFILNDKDASSLSDEYDIIPKLVQCLTKALKMKGRKAHLGFSAEEIVNALSNLAINDENKIKLVKNGILPLLVKMLGLSSVHKERAVSCLWRLAFSEDVRQLILVEPNCCEQLGAIASPGTGDTGDTDQPEDLRSKARNALEFIRLGKNGLGSSAVVKNERNEMARPTTGHIFLSYSWKQQAIVIKIRDALVERGYNVWLDIERMHGSTLEAMASAVENAFVVIICYSEHYRTSNMCRTEAEYVFRLQKPFIPVNFQRLYQPDGWLGIIIGAKLYVDFSLEKYSFEDVILKLFNEITQFEKGGNVQEAKSPATSSSKPPSSQGAKVVAEPSSSSSSCSDCKTLAAKVDRLCELVETLSAGTFSSQNNYAIKLPDQNTKQFEMVRKWSSPQIGTWLKKENFPTNFAQSLSNFDGCALIGLYEMKSTAPDSYYKSILQLCNDSFPLCIRFTCALENLFNKQS